MAGTMREKKTGVWELRAYAGRDPVTRHPRQVSRTFHGGKRDAGKALSALVAEVDGKVAGSNATFGTLLDDWMRLIGPNRSPKTLDGYRRIIEQRIRPVLGDVPLARLDVHTLDTWYGQLQAEGLAPRTVRNVHAIVRAALNQGMRWGWVQRNVAELARPPAVPADPRRHFADDDVTLVLRAVADTDPTLGRIVAVIAATGCRRGEVLALRWSDIDLERGLVHIRRSIVIVSPGPQLIEKDTKTHAERTVAVDPATVAALTAHREQMQEIASISEVDYGEDALVFSPAPDGSVPVNPDRVTQTWLRCCKRAKVTGLRLHDLRHWHASYLLGLGLQLEAVSERLGHRDKSTTQNTYSHAIPRHDATAAKMVGRVLGGLNDRKAE